MKPTIATNTGEIPVLTTTTPLSGNYANSGSHAEKPHTRISTQHLLEIDFPLFEEATQTAARFVGTPVSFIGIPIPHAIAIKAAVGLSHLGLMNPLARTRRLPLEDELFRWVLREGRPLVLSGLREQSPFNESVLVHEYGIRAFLGVPMLTDEGTCIGLLVAMDTDPHEFSPEAIAFMELLARWSVSEYERHCLTEALKTASLATSASSTDSLQGTLLDTVRFTLMSQLTQDMRNPLTTINGMSNMLSREIYGTLSPKQREYADIIHNSSRHLLEVAHEVLELGSLDTGVYSIHPTAVDVEMIGQQVQRLLLPITSKNNQYISVTVEPGSRLWILDREVLRHCLYYLVYCMVNLSGEGGTIRIHGTERDHSLHLGVWLVHPWLGEGLPSAVANLFQQINDPMKERTVLVALLAKAIGRPEAIATPEATTGFERTQESFLTKSRETLSFLLSRHLVEQYGGTMMMQGNVDTGYRLTITLPFKKSVVGEGTMD